MKSCGNLLRDLLLFLFFGALNETYSINSKYFENFFPGNLIAGVNLNLFEQPVFLQPISLTLNMKFNPL